MGVDLQHLLDVSVLEAAAAAEIAEARKGASELWLDIDAIELVAQSAGSYVYRLLLSRPVRLQPEQTLAFTSRSKDKIQGVVVSSTDSEIVVDCVSPLPDDTRLQHVEFDPSFIYQSLLDFVKQRLASENPIVTAVLSKQLSLSSPRHGVAHRGLNEEQQRAIGGMRGNLVHLLWGPPGTGKTTTLGAAIVEWMREGKSVLVVSTSNAAVDVALKNVLKRMKPLERKWVVRLGTSTDPEVIPLTLGAKYGEQNISEAIKAEAAQAELRKISDAIGTKPTDTVALQRLFAQRKPLEAILEKFRELVANAAVKLLDEARVIACTLAKMTLDPKVRGKLFDVVVVDEASMVSLFNGVAASMLAYKHLVFAGDPKQLPPIVQSDAPAAERWFGTNIFRWLGLQSAQAVDHLPASLLRTQYRMTRQIGGLVSRLSYGDQLLHGRDKDGLTATLVEVPGQWQTKLWSVREQSFYQPASALILHGLFACLGGEAKDMLLLAPYRAQQSLLAALAFDLKSRFPKWNIGASTIHRSQGSERNSVVVDLTTHDPESPSSFFDDEVGEFLFNVAISRATDQLFVLASREMLLKLSAKGGLWQRLASELSVGLSSVTVAELLEDITCLKSLTEITMHPPTPGIAAVCCCGKREPTADEMAALDAATAVRKLLVASSCPKDGAFIFREPTASCTPLFCAHGHVALPFEGRWFEVHSPSLNRAIWRIAFGHLADEEVNPSEARRFFCPSCVPGSLVIRKTGEGMFLACDQAPFACQYRRRMSLDDAKAKVRLTGMMCPLGHPLTVRSGAKGLFLGCENYPRCDFTQSLAILQGT
jgi:hypothetical protein